MCNTKISASSHLNSITKALNSYAIFSAPLQACNSDVMCWESPGGEICKEAASRQFNLFVRGKMQNKCCSFLPQHKAINVPFSKAQPPPRLRVHIKQIQTCFSKPNQFKPVEMDFLERECALNFNQ